MSAADKSLPSNGQKMPVVKDIAVEAMLRAGKTYREIEKMCNVSNATIAKVRKEIDSGVRSNDSAVEQATNMIANQAMEKAGMIANSISQADLDNANLAQKSVAFEKIVKTNRLMTNQSTQNTNIISHIFEHMED